MNAKFWEINDFYSILAKLSKTFLQRPQRWNDVGGSEFYVIHICLL